MWNNIAISFGYIIPHCGKFLKDKRFYLALRFRLEKYLDGGIEMNSIQKKIQKIKLLLLKQRVNKIYLQIKIFFIFKNKRLIIKEELTLPLIKN